MTEVEQSGSRFDKPIASGPTEEAPRRFDINEDALRLTRFSSGSEQASGLIVGYYDKEDGTRVDIVSPMGVDSLYDEVEVVDGEVVRILSGAFLAGESVSVVRSDGKLDSGWEVTRSDVKENGTKITYIRKETPEGTLDKRVATDTLRQLNGPSEVSPEQLEAESEHLKAQAALGKKGTEQVVQAPEVDMSEADVSEADVSESKAVEAEAPEETEAEMYERFMRETKQELDGLYNQLRKVDPKSYEAVTLENQIKYTKEDLGAHDRKLRELQRRQQ